MKVDESFGCQAAQVNSPTCPLSLVRFISTFTEQKHIRCILHIAKVHVTFDVRCTGEDSKFHCFRVTTALTFLHHLCQTVLVGLFLKSPGISTHPAKISGRVSGVLLEDTEYSDLRTYVIVAFRPRFPSFEGFWRSTHTTKIP